MVGFVGYDDISHSMTVYTLCPKKYVHFYFFNNSVKIYQF